MLQLGKLEKVEITAYEKAARTGKGEKLIFNINPTQVSSRHENQFTRLRGINTSGRSAPYAKSHSDVLNLQLVIDDTIEVNSLVPFVGKKSKTIAEQIEDFLTFCAYMDGKIHEPRFLRVRWGSIDFECRLQSVEIRYTRFDEKGNPLRAELDTVFVADMPDSKRIRLENKKSPDITHTRIARQGDTLTGLCKEVYGSAEFFLIVAKANRLNHFRKLIPGEEIFFPPLEQ
jgi:hypothetical protein